MQITVKIKLKPTQEQAGLIKATSAEYVRLVNQIVSDYVCAGVHLKYSSKDVTANLPSAVRNQAIQDAKSIFAKHRKNVRRNSKLKPEDQKEIKVPILKRPVAIWNNQNYSRKGNKLSFPVIVDKRSKLIEVQAMLTDYQHNRLKGKTGSLRITRKSGKYIAQIAAEAKEEHIEAGKLMGVDLGLKIPCL